MAYTYDQVDDLQNTAKVGSKQCVALVQTYAKAPVTSAWKAGKAVLGETTLKKGTAIATFVDGKYASNATGNHAALYLSQDLAGIWIMDQWASDASKPKVSKRYLRRKGRLATGGFVDPSNNAEAYAVIE
ncbi:conserved hypothetical protein [Rubrivivax sp. A210]|uniref:BPSL0067 family protein n=1 Tax=Rubrivivax sp. A210 TaxID=2772301 RepID=UPI0019AE81D1|nr:BPSL0067 family protein [Rubrivivax sp. A210]CAD5374828.1 conserved hypothetical protein [Rubrivivax sp. A210]